MKNKEETNKQSTDVAEQFLRGILGELRANRGQIFKIKGNLDLAFVRCI